VRQAWHIFKKDARYLRWEVLLVLAFMGAFVYSQTTRLDVDDDTRDLVIVILVACVWAFVCARLIQAEAIPGDRQFWLTRPYSRRSLLGAKLLFVVVVLSIPLLAADAAILAIDGFPLAENLTGLLLSILLINAGVLVTLCAFATLTRGLARWTLSALVAVGAFAGVKEMESTSGWGGVEWMRSLAIVAIFFATGSVVLLLQYKGRRTVPSIAVMTAGVLAAWLFWSYAPSRVAFGIQTAFSKRMIDTSQVKIEMRDEGSQTFAVPLAAPPKELLMPTPSTNADQGPMKYVAIPLDVSGLSEGTRLSADHIRVSYEIQHPLDDNWGHCGAGGLSWSTDVDVLPTLHLPVDGKFFAKAIDCLTTIRLTFYLTEFGNPVTKLIRAQSKPTVIRGVGICTNDEGFGVRCISALRAPTNHLNLESKHGLRTLIEEISYSPLPADFSILPLRRYSMPGWSGNTDDALTTIEPALLHFRTNVVLNNIYLSKFQVLMP
jgi:hypothetical protein